MSINSGKKEINPFTLQSRPHDHTTSLTLNTSIPNLTCQEKNTKQLSAPPTSTRSPTQEEKPQKKQKQQHDNDDIKSISSIAGRTDTSSSTHRLPLTLYSDPLATLAQCATTLFQSHSDMKTSSSSTPLSSIRTSIKSILNLTHETPSLQLSNDASIKTSMSTKRKRMNSMKKGKSKKLTKKSTVSSNSSMTTSIPSISSSERKSTTASPTSTTTSTNVSSTVTMTTLKHTMTPDSSMFFHYHPTPPISYPPSTTQSSPPSTPGHNDDDGSFSRISSKDMMNIHAHAIQKLNKPKKSIVVRKSDAKILARTNSPSDDSNHGNIDTANLKNVCPLCSRQFKRTFNLKTHILTHNDIRRFECDNCFSWYVNFVLRLSIPSFSFFISCFSRFKLIMDLIIICCYIVICIYLKVHTKI